MKTSTLLFVVFAAAFVVLTSCEQKGIDLTAYGDEDYALLSQTLNLPTYPVEYDFRLPSYAGGSSTSIDNNLATLGRVLFYDKNLSKDRSVSCASCHQQKLAFSDDEAFSEGVEERRTTRNSLALGSSISFAVYYGSASLGLVPFFWDNRASSVQEQSEQTLANSREMDMEMHEVVGRVKELEYYGPLFEASFRDRDITEERVLDAINEFVNSLASFNSKFDQEMSKASDISRDFSGFTGSENLGKNLYNQNCSSCHGAVMSRPTRLEANNGLDMSYEDRGIGEISQNTSQYGLFKVPTLRNIELTAPYMHDGRFATLHDVMDHYSEGVMGHENLSFGLPVGGFNFTATEKQGLVDFLSTLTDHDYINDEKFADPFK